MYIVTVSWLSKSGLDINFLRHLSFGQVHLRFTCPCTKVTCPGKNVSFLLFIIIYIHVFGTLLIFRQTPWFPGVKSWAALPLAAGPPPLHHQPSIKVFQLWALYWQKNQPLKLYWAEAGPPVGFDPFHRREPYFSHSCADWQDHVNFQECHQTPEPFTSLIWKDKNTRLYFIGLSFWWQQLSWMAPRFPCLIYPVLGYFNCWHYPAARRCYI